jgi:hypothetical protein
MGFIPPVAQRSFTFSPNYICHYSFHPFEIRIISSSSSSIPSS